MIDRMQYLRKVFLIPILVTNKKKKLNIEGSFYFDSSGHGIQLLNSTKMFKI